ncbi:T9SS type A sorting domain-containing protein [Bacteroidota bacterium]
MKYKFYTRFTMVFITILMFAYVAIAQTTITVAITDGAYDAEETIAVVDAEDALGGVDLTSSDLELGFDHSPAAVGLIFLDVQIPAGATITNAYVQFTVDALSEGSTDGAVTMEVYGAKEANVTGPFTEDPFAVTSHPPTTAKVTWSPGPSVAVGDAGVNEQTPDLSAVITEIIGVAGWASGNGLMIVVKGDPAQTEDINREVEAAPPEGDGGTSLVVTYTGGTGVNSFRADLSKSIYPNPTAGILNIENPSTDKFSFEIYTINGKLVASRNNIAGPTTNVDMSSFAKGVYFVNVKNSETTETHKLILK